MSIKSTNKKILSVALAATTAFGLSGAFTSANAQTYMYTKYLSELNPTSQSVGWNNNGKNAVTNNTAPDGSSIKLLNKDGQEQQFSKGIGAHADSKVEYDIPKDMTNFTAMIGIDDRERHYAEADAKFKVLVDGKEVYKSGIVKGGTPMQPVNVNVINAEKLTLITDKLDNNWGDHTVWADAKFTKVDQPATIIAPKTMSFSEKDLTTNDVVKEIKKVVKAYDYKGADISDQIGISGGIRKGVRGKYTFTISVPNGPHNTATKTIKIVPQETYLSDMTESAKVVGWGGLQKDKAPDGSTIELLGEDNKEKEYKKGIGAHAYSNILYDLDSDFGLDKFTATIGLDKAVRGLQSNGVVFKVLGDGKVLYTSKHFGTSTKAENISVDIKGVQQLRLVVESNKNAVHDQAVWADAKVISNNEELPKDEAYLSDMSYSSSQVGWGNVSIDKNIYNGEKISLLKDGKEKEYEKGIGAHGYSQVIYDLNPHLGLKTLTATIGLDKLVRGLQSDGVVFKVYGDGQELYKSPTIGTSTEAVDIKVNIQNVRQLKLVVESGRGATHDQAIWADAKISSKEADKLFTQKTYLSDLQAIVDSSRNVTLPTNDKTSRDKDITIIDGSGTSTKYVKGIGIAGNYGDKFINYKDLDKQGGCYKKLTGILGFSTMPSSPSDSTVVTFRTFTKDSVVKNHSYEISPSKPFVNIDVDMNGVTALYIDVNNKNNSHYADVVLADAMLLN